MCDVVESLFGARRACFLRLGGLFLMLFWEDLGGGLGVMDFKFFRSSVRWFLFL